MKATGQDILEVGCGAGYGAVLISTLHPRSYVGIDLMPEISTIQWMSGALIRMLRIVTRRVSEEERRFPR